MTPNPQPTITLRFDPDGLDEVFAKGSMHIEAMDVGEYHVGIEGSDGSQARGCIVGVLAMEAEAGHVTVEGPDVWPNAAQRRRVLWGLALEATPGLRWLGRRVLARYRRCEG